MNVMSHQKRKIRQKQNIKIENKAGKEKEVQQLQLWQYALINLYLYNIQMIYLAFGKRTIISPKLGLLFLYQDKEQ